MNSALQIERTLAVIRPRAIQHRLAIVRRIQLAGLSVLQERFVRLSAEQTRKFHEHLWRGKNDDETSLEIEEWTSGPLLALCLAGENAIECWKMLMGPSDCTVARESAPTSIRALYGSYNDGSDITNATSVVHGSNSANDARRELRFFFPRMIPQVEKSLAGDIEKYVRQFIAQPLTNAIYEMLKVKPSDPVAFIANHMLDNNHKNGPTVCAEASPESLALIRECKQEEDDVEPECRENIKKANCGCSISCASSLSSF